VFLLGLVLDAALLGTILVVMTEEFPGWGPLVGIVFAIGVTGNAVGGFLPWPVSLLGLVVAAGVGALLIAWTCAVPRRRAAAAAGVYLGVRLLATLLVPSLSLAA
jgi:hypothetical protein